MVSTITVIRLTAEPITLFSLKINAIKMMNKDAMANIVVYGYHFTWKAGLSLYWERSFNWAEQMLIHNKIIVKPGMDIR